MPRSHPARPRPPATLPPHTHFQVHAGGAALSVSVDPGRLTVAGELTATTVRLLIGVIERQLATARFDVLVEGAGLSRVEPEAIGLLRPLHDRCHAGGGGLRLRGIRPDTLDLAAARRPGRSAIGSQRADKVRPVPHPARTFRTAEPAFLHRTIAARAAWASDPAWTQETMARALATCTAASEAVVSSVAVREHCRAARLRIVDERQRRAVRPVPGAAGCDRWRDLSERRHLARAQH